MNLIMELFITGNGRKKAYVKVKAFKYGKTEASIKDTGEMIGPMDMVG